MASSRDPANAAVPSYYAILHLELTAGLERMLGGCVAHGAICWMHSPEELVVGHGRARGELKQAVDLIREPQLVCLGIKFPDAEPRRFGGECHPFLESIQCFLL